MKRTAGRVSPPPVKRQQLSTITQKAVANFFAPASQKQSEPEKVTWRTINDSLLIGKYQRSQPVARKENGQRQKIAAFDFDSTLVNTASGLKFGRDATDWKWWHNSVQGTLRRCHKEGYLLVVLTNQSGIQLQPTNRINTKRLTEFKRKATAVFTQLDLPITTYAATTQDRYRKPRTGMWEQVLQDYGLAAGDVDFEHSVFVGDAGGRQTNGKMLKDFSCSDRNFAHNVGIAFKTPDEFFLNEAPRPFVRDFDPAAYVGTVAATPIGDAAAAAFTKTNDVDIVLFCGSPGAGKSTFHWTQLKPLGYERVNQDILKTREKCLKVATEFIQGSKSVVVDNTNADPQTREHWVKLSRKLDVPIRCVLFTAGISLCIHNDAVRAFNAETQGLNPEKRTMLPRMAFTSFAARYKEPKVEEGFQDITRVEFRFQGTDEEKAVWTKFWT